VTRLDLQRGATVAGKYTIEHELGSGGMGIVLAATHVDLGSRVAVKVLTVEGRAAGDAVVRFLREARAAARLRSEFVARVSDFGTLEDGRPFMVLEYLEGHDLGVLLARKIPREELVDAICQACAGLAEAHAAGIIHRDLKPSNLFRSRRPDGSHCTKVLDFGISKLLGGAPDALVTTKTSAILGTPLYMSPEQVRSTRDVDARTDVWSLGVVLAEALLGRAPFGGDSLGAVFSRIIEAEPSFDQLTDVPVELYDVVRRCLKKRADDRYADVAELAMALAPFASDEGRDAARRARATVIEAAKPSAIAPAQTPPLDLELVEAPTVAAAADAAPPIRTVAARSLDSASRRSAPSIVPLPAPAPGTAVTVDRDRSSGSPPWRSAPQSSRAPWWACGRGGRAPRRPLEASAHRP